MEDNRLGMFAAVVVLTAFAIMYWRDTRERYWILRDGVRSTAHVTDEGGHNSIYYTYSTTGANFSGYGPREYRDERYAHVGIGGQSVVWYSASHPWISTPRRPDAVVVGLPWIALVTLLDVLCAVSLVVSWRDARAKARNSARLERRPAAG